MCGPKAFPADIFKIYYKLREIFVLKYITDITRVLVVVNNNHFNSDQMHFNFFVQISTFFC